MDSVDERVTVRMNKHDCESIDQLVDDGVYPNRSAAIRAAIRGLLAEHPDARTDDAGRPVLADGGFDE